MNSRQWILFIISAILYALPMLFSPWLWWLVFIYPIPLLYLALETNLSFGYGFLWGLITFSLHESSVLWGIDNFAQGSLLARLLPSLIVISYTALYPAIWFWINKLITNYRSPHSTSQKLLQWTLSYWLFILFMDHCSMWAFGRLEGYFLLNPIFALAEQPKLLILLPVIGKALFTLLPFCLAGAVVYWHITRKRCAGVLILALLAPWILSIAIPLPRPAQPAWLFKIVPLQKAICGKQSIKWQIKEAQRLFKEIVVIHPEAELIVMPESSFYCDSLDIYPSLCNAWVAKKIGRPLDITVGSFRWDGPSYRNTLHWIQDGTLKDVFDKRHAMVLVERLPPWLSCTALKDLFFKNFPCITPSTKKRPQLQLLADATFIPYICSELFFNDHPDDSYGKGTTILATTNDIWCKTTNIAHLMNLAARFRAVQWQRNILYISFLYANYYDTYGNQIMLTP